MTLTVMTSCHSVKAAGLEMLTVLSCQVYHDCFTSTPHPMDSGFVHTVTKNFVAQMHAYDTRDAK
eukprot:m.929322 g.929322  ORF g.929322 m.929322 type:complete len:65 (+) comp23781_c0_seq22:2559-2753(+)